MSSLCENVLEIYKTSTTSKTIVVDFLLLNEDTFKFSELKKVSES